MQMQCIYVEIRCQIYPFLSNFLSRVQCEIDSLESKEKEFRRHNLIGAASALSPVRLPRLPPTVTAKESHARHRPRRPREPRLSQGNAPNINLSLTSRCFSSFGCGGYVNIKTIPSSIFKRHSRKQQAPAYCACTASAEVKIRLNCSLVFSLVFELEFSHSPVSSSQS